MTEASKSFANDPNYPASELTAILIGLTFEMYNRLGYGYQEKYYHRAYEQLLKDRGIPYQHEQKAVIQFQNRQIGRYFMDFVVDKNVVIEFKVANDFYLQHTKQVLGYLKATGLKVGLLILITKGGIKVKRIVNTNSISA